MSGDKSARSFVGKVNQGLVVYDPSDLFTASVFPRGQLLTMLGDGALPTGAKVRFGATLLTVVSTDFDPAGR